MISDWSFICRKAFSVFTVRVPLIAAALIFTAARSAHADSSSELHGSFTLHSGDYSVHFSPFRACQMDQISFQGQMMGIKNGNYEFAFHGGDGKFIGGSHADSGSKETVIQTRLVVDGKEIAAPAPAEIKGQQAEFITESRIRGLLVTRRVVVTPSGIERNLDLQVEEDTFIGVGYAFMLIWTPATTEWMAQLRDTAGTVVEGVFDNQGWELKKEASWVAVYEPVMKVAMLAEYPPENLPGKDIRYALWDLPVYHKLYYQPFARETLKAGDHYKFKVIVRGFRAEPGQWKEAVVNAVSKRE